MLARFVGLFGVAAGFEDINQRCPPVRSVVQRLGRLGRLRMIGGVLFVGFRFALRTLVAAAPVAADFGINQIVGRQLRPFGMRKFFLHFFQEAVVHVGAQRGIGLPC